MNKVILVGRLTRDVELRYIAGTGTPVANFSLAVDREFTGRDGKRETDFIDIQTWGKSAENCSEYIGKGSLVSVSGSLRIDNYKAQDGSNRRAVKVNAERVQFLDSKKPSTNKQEPVKETVPSFEPSFVPSENLDYNEMFTDIVDEELPF